MIDLGMLKSELEGFGLNVEMWEDKTTTFLRATDPYEPDFELEITADKRMNLKGPRSAELNAVLRAWF